MLAIKYPSTKDYGGFNEDYVAALEAHTSYIAEQLVRLRGLFVQAKEPPDWIEKEDVISVTLDKKPEGDLAISAVRNLVGYAAHQGKEIVRAWQGMREGKWQLIAQVHKVA